MQRWMTQNMYQPSTIVGIPRNYSLFSSSLCIASCETSLALLINGMDWNANLVNWVSINFTSFIAPPPPKNLKTYWGEWSTISLIGGGHNFMTSMNRSSQINFCGKNSEKSIKYSQSYDIVYQLAFLGGKGFRWSNHPLQAKSSSQRVNLPGAYWYISIPRTKEAAMRSISWHMHTNFQDNPQVS